MLCPRVALRPSLRALPLVSSSSSSSSLLALSTPSRPSSSSASQPQQAAQDDMSPPEASIAALLAANLPPAAHSIRVRDISGGCGAMYAIHVASPLFRGLPLLRQQRLVTKALGDRVRDWHGLQIRTDVLDDGPGNTDATS